MDKISKIHKELWDLAGPVLIRWMGTDPFNCFTSQLQVVVPTEEVAQLIPSELEGIKLSILIRPESFERK